MHRNPILLSDSYKVSHHLQYPPGTQHVYSYWESRGGKFDEITMFGLQALLKRYFTKPVTMEDIDYAEERFALHFNDATLFNRKGWERIVTVHGGFLPLRIKAVPEGTPVPYRNVMMTVENTDPELPWLTNYMETLLCQLWYPTTVATQSREIKRVIKAYLEKTGDVAGLPFKLHDFGFRGVSSVETAEFGGAAHLINFMGTDNMIAFEFLYENYDESMAGFSIPAAEHSTITSWGKTHEAEAFRNMINQFGSGGGGLYAVVSDSYDIFNACENLWGDELYEEVMAAPNTLVVRPDSGDPVTVILKVLKILGNKFGYETNKKGYKVINKVRVIQGDGVNRESITEILSSMEMAGWSTDNIAFGMGGALLQQLDRDTCRFAFKAASITIDGEEHDVWKDPVTDHGKSSKRGRMRLVYNDGYFKDQPRGYITVMNSGWSPKDELQVVYENGELFNHTTLSEVRERASV